MKLRMGEEVNYVLKYGNRYDPRPRAHHKDCRYVKSYSGREVTSEELMQIDAASCQVCEPEPDILRMKIEKNDLRLLIDLLEEQVATPGNISLLKHLASTYDRGGLE